VSLGNCCIAVGTVSSEVAGSTASGEASSIKQLWVLVIVAVGWFVAVLMIFGVDAALMRKARRIDDGNDYNARISLIANYVLGVVWLLSSRLMGW